MKVHSKGQAVIPAQIHRGLGIAIGDQLDAHIDIGAQRIELNNTPATRHITMQE